MRKLRVYVIGKRTLERMLAFAKGVISSDKEWDTFVYFRKSPRGKHTELWQHVSGCRQWIKVERDTATHEIFNTYKANEEIA